MTPNKHNACPACPTPVQDLYAAAERLLHILNRDGALTAGAVEDLVAATGAMRPHIEAHFFNHDHATSPELVGARQPRAPISLVLERGLPFHEELATSR